MLSGATRSPDAMRRKSTVATLTALQECTERHRTVVGMCSGKVGSRCAKCFSDVLPAVQMDPMFSSPMAPLLRGRLKSPTKTIPPKSCFVLLFFCSCVRACDTAAGRRGGPLSAPPRANLFGEQEPCGRCSAVAAGAHSSGLELQTRHTQ